MNSVEYLARLISNRYRNLFLDATEAISWALTCDNGAFHWKNGHLIMNKDFYKLNRREDLSTIQGYTYWSDYSYGIMHMHDRSIALEAPANIKPEWRKEVIKYLEYQTNTYDSIIAKEKLDELCSVSN